MIFTNPSQSRESYLIIEWDKQRLSFSIFHENTNRVLASSIIDTDIDIYTCTQHELEQFIKAQDIFAFSYKKVICIITSHYGSLIPNKFKESISAEEVLQLNHELPSGNLQYAEDLIASTPYTYVYAYPKFINQVFEQSLKNYSITHFSSVQLNLITKFKDANTIFNIHYSHKNLVISFWDERSLSFHNTFEVSTAEDIVYYTLNVIHELNLNNERINVYYSGAFEENGSILKLLSSYIKFLKPLERTNKINYATDVEAIPSHYFVHHYITCI